MSLAPEGALRPPSLLRSLVPPVLFMLVCGIVGPIFLIMGLTVDEPGTEWLLPTGIGITALDLVIGVVIGRGRHRTRQRLHRLRQNGRPARAQVLSFEQTGVRINEQPMLVLQLRIHGEDLEPFEAQAREVVPEIRVPLLYAGELPVLVDPETHEWEIDWDSAKTITPAVPLAPATSSAPSAPRAPADDRTAGERLAELDDLLRQDLLSREEYDAARARIIAEL